MAAAAIAAYCVPTFFGLDVDIMSEMRDDPYLGFPGVSGHDLWDEASEQAHGESTRPSSRTSLFEDAMSSYTPSGLSESTTPGDAYARDGHSAAASPWPEWDAVGSSAGGAPASGGSRMQSSNARQRAASRGTKRAGARTKYASEEEFREARRRADREAKRRARERQRQQIVQLQEQQQSLQKDLGNMRAYVTSLENEAMELWFKLSPTIESSAGRAPTRTDDS